METLYLLIFFFIFIISSIFYFSSFTSKSQKTTKHIGFKSYPIVGTLPDFLLNIHRFHDWSTDVLSRCPTNTSVFRQPGTVHGVFTANPANVEHMLKTNFDNYPKGNNFLSHLHDFLGNGIFNSDGELWRTQRKTSSYEFNTKSLRNFVMENVKVEIQTRFIPLLESSCKTGNVLDFQEVFERFAFDNICKLAFNVDPGCLNGDGIEGTEFMQAFDDASNISSGRFTYTFASVYKFKKLLNIGSEKILKQSIATVHEFADNIIKTRLQVRGENKDEDLLSRFMCNTENSVEFLRDIVISVILAGRDTTSSALTWFFWLLSTKPDVENKIIRELRIIRDQNNKKFDDIYTLDELREMHYLHAAISEAMRLYPPVPFDTKACLADDVLPDGTFVGKGWFMSYSAYAMGRMENIWGKDCCEFKPERWLENGVFRHENPFKYPIFHAGPRMCLGKEMAFIQMKSIVAAVLERFSIEVLLEDGKTPEYLISLTLRMKSGLHVQAKERCVKIVD